MEQYNTPIERHNMIPVAEHTSPSNNSHLYSLIHRLMETVDKQARQISRLESSLNEVKNNLNNR